MQSTAEQTLADFLNQLLAATPVPGGGTAAAVAGAMAASLAGMVANLTLGKEKYAAVQDEMAGVAAQAAATLDACLRAADADRDAFDQVMRAYALPRGSEAEKAERTAAIQSGLQAATQSPLETMAHALAAARAAAAAAARGNHVARTDAICAYLLARAAFQGALWNVAVNLVSIKDTSYRAASLETIGRLQQELAAVDGAMAAIGLDPLRVLVGDR